MSSRADKIDGGTAMIIVDRCRPPEGLASSPSTIKSVLWCLRGLGGPGAELRVHSDVIEHRTCLTRRTVSKVMTCLIEAGVVHQTARPSPHSPARYTVDYARLADWLDPEDRAMVRVPACPNAGTSFSRSQEPASHDREKEIPTKGASWESGSPIVRTSFHHREKEIPTTYIGNSCIRPAEDQQQQQHEDAAAAAAISVGEWSELGKVAKLDPGIAGQAAEALVAEGWTDRKTGLIALERLAERLAGGDVRNPIGLFLTLLRRPGGPETSQAEIRRAKRAEAEIDAKRVSYLSTLSPAHHRKLARRVEALVPGGEAWAKGGRWIVPIPTPAFRKARETIWAHWDEITNAELAHAS